MTTSNAPPPPEAPNPRALAHASAAARTSAWLAWPW